jgi:hypothetical protein
MGKLGQTLGSIAGGLGSLFLPIPGIDGARLGGALGGALPFRMGGRVHMARKAPAKKRGGAAKKKRGGAVKAKKRGGK